MCAYSKLPMMDKHREHTYTYITCTIATCTLVYIHINTMDMYIIYMCTIYMIFHVLSCNGLIYRLMASISFYNPQMQKYVHSKRKSTHAEMSYMCLQQHTSHLTTNTYMHTRTHTHTHARMHTRMHTHTHTPFDHSVWCTVYTIAYRYTVDRAKGYTYPT